MTKLILFTAAVLYALCRFQAALARARKLHAQPDRLAAGLRRALAGVTF